MIYITTAMETHTYYAWYNVLPIPIQDIVEIRADRGDVSVVKEVFPHLCPVTPYQIIFYGDIAKLIYANCVPKHVQDRL